MTPGIHEANPATVMHGAGGAWRLRRRTAQLAAVLRANRADLALACGLAVLAGVASYVGSALMHSVVASRETFDMWFDADAPRVFDNMVSRLSNYKRSDVHPLFGLIAFPPVYALRRLGVDNWTAVRLVIALVAATWMGAFFTLLRRMTLPRGDACLFALLAGTSAAAMFWFVLPETISFGSVTILLALILTVESVRRPVAIGWTAAVGVLTLGVTVSNWAAGLLAAAAIHARRDLVRVVVLTICSVALLTSVSVYVFPNANLFGVSRRVIAEEPTFVRHPESGGPVRSAKAFVFHSTVMPRIQVAPPDWDWLKWRNLRVQYSAVGSGSALGVPAALVWFALLALGAWGVWTVKALGATRVVLVGALAAQFTLHALFGREVFLYSLHFAPLLVVLAAVGALTPLRRVSLALGALLLPLLLVNNTAQFRHAMTLFDTYHPPAALLRDTVALRGADRQPDARGAMQLAASGEDGRTAAYVGAGGSVSPWERSFGIALWAVNGDEIVLTSDTFLAMTQTVRRDILRPPFSVETDNYYFKSVLTIAPGAPRTILIRQTDNFMTRLAMVVRAGGPSGGPVNSIDWDGRRLLVNDRWRIVVDPAPTVVRVGEEGSPGVLVRHGNHWASERGLGFAILELAPQSHAWVAEITALGIVAR